MRTARTGSCTNFAKVSGISGFDRETRQSGHVARIPQRALCKYSHLKDLQLQGGGGHTWPQVARRPATPSGDCPSCTNLMLLSHFRSKQPHFRHGSRERMGQTNRVRVLAASGGR
jgi:hypothetical protein